jgi:hypothetical protein
MEFNGDRVTQAWVQFCLPTSEWEYFVCSLTSALLAHLGGFTAPSFYRLLRPSPRRRSLIPHPRRPSRSFNPLPPRQPSSARPPVRQQRFPLTRRPQPNYWAGHSLEHPSPFPFLPLPRYPLVVLDRSPIAMLPRLAHSSRKPITSIM